MQRVTYTYHVRGTGTYAEKPDLPYTRTLWEIAEESVLRTLQTRREEQSEINNVDLALEPAS